MPGRCGVDGRLYDLQFPLGDVDGVSREVRVEAAVIVDQDPVEGLVLLQAVQGKVVNPRRGIGLQVAVLSVAGPTVLPGA